MGGDRLRTFQRGRTHVENRGSDSEDAAFSLHAASGQRGGVTGSDGMWTYLFRANVPLTFRPCFPDSAQSRHNLKCGVTGRALSTAELVSSGRCRDREVVVVHG